MPRCFKDSSLLCKFHCAVSLLLIASWIWVERVSLISFLCALPTNGCLVMLLFLRTLRNERDTNAADCFSRCIGGALSTLPRGLQVSVRYISVGLGGKPNVITSDCLFDQEDQDGPRAKFDRITLRYTDMRSLRPPFPAAY